MDSFTREPLVVHRPTLSVASRFLPPTTEVGAYRANRRADNNPKPGPPWDESDMAFIMPPRGLIAPSVPGLPTRTDRPNKRLEVRTTSQRASSSARARTRQIS
jgi:hypothetical protein